MPAFTARRDGDGPDPLALPGHVGEHPPALPLAQVLDLEPHELGPTPAATAKQAQHGPVAQAGQPCARRERSGGRRTGSLTSQLPARVPRRSTPGTRSIAAADRRVEHSVVAHLPRQLAHRRRPQSSASTVTYAAATRCRAVALDQGAGERRC